MLKRAYRSIGRAISPVLMCSARGGDCVMRRKDGNHQYFRAFNRMHACPIPVGGLAWVVGESLTRCSGAIGYLRAGGINVVWFRSMNDAVPGGVYGEAHCDLLIVDLDHTSDGLEATINSLLRCRSKVRVPTICASIAFSGESRLVERQGIYDASIASMNNLSDVEEAIMWALLNCSSSDDQLESVREFLSKR